MHKLSLDILFMHTNLCFVFIFTFFPQCFNKFWENSLCTEDPLPYIHLPTTVRSLVSYKKPSLALEIFLFVLFLLFLHPFTNCYFLYFCSLFSFLFLLIAKVDEWRILEGYWGLLGFALTQHCDASSAHDCKALENLTMLNFEFQ